jgi:pSer/pThr/pTyr-binding forkhead associated (FHA) protein
MYKYDCRKCPIRNRCIDESDNSPSIKSMIRNAFNNRTDTRATWGLLQINCLLVKSDQEREQRASQESLLSRRLRQIREAKEGSAPPPEPSRPPDYLQPVSAKSSVPPPASQAKYPELPAKSPNRYETSNINPSDSPSGTASPSEEPRPNLIGTTEALPKFLPNKPKSVTSQAKVRLVWLTVVGSNHHIALPDNGEIVLGRFDPNLGIPPDIDLAFEDGGTRVVSRRHAKITGRDGQHMVEDLGSRHGVSVNGEPVSKPRLLQLGDQIMLGNLRLHYDLAPLDRLELGGANPRIHHFLVVTATGEKVALTPAKEMVVGRSDRYVNFTPDLDLGPLGEVAIRVSRRHAIVTWRNYAPYVEDLGSGFGTRLNGEMLLLGQAVPLRPGDHIWLGGCVLAYDVEV